MYKQTFLLEKVTNYNVPPTFGVNQFYNKNITARSSVNIQQEIDARSGEVKKETEEEMDVKLEEWKNKYKIGEEKVKIDGTNNYWDE